MIDFTPDPDCDNCDGTGQWERGTDCHFCLSDAIRRGELDGIADDIEYKGGKPTGRTIRDLKAETA